jgi:ParB family transcriptional regulator, chromosome partitioning protein
MMEKRKVLGRGLETLLPSRPATTLASAVHPGEAIHQLAVELIDRNPYQTRSHVDEAALKELADSIQATGVLQPITVRAVPGGRYQLIAGERRWLASQRAGKATVPAIVRQVSNEQAMEMTIVENLQREDLNPIEQARAFDRLGREFGLTQEQISLRTGKERSSVANFLRLLRLPEQVQAWVAARHLSFGHAKLLLALDSPEAMAAIGTRVIERGLSVRQTEEAVESWMHPPHKEMDKRLPEAEVDPNVREAEKQLEQALGVRVAIKDRRGRGKIVLEYSSLEDFDRILTSLTSK